MNTAKIRKGTWVLVTDSPTTGGSYTGTVKSVNRRSLLGIGSYSVVPTTPVFPCPDATAPLRFIVEASTRVEKISD